jgi:hypothetical protein
MACTSWLYGTGILKFFIFNRSWKLLRLLILCRQWFLCAGSMKAGFNLRMPMPFTRIELIPLAWLKILFLQKIIGYCT